MPETTALQTIASSPRRVFAIVAALLFLALLVFTWHHPHYPLGRMTPSYRFVGAIDWPIFVDTAKQAIAGAPVYRDDMTAYAPDAPVYKFPPVFISGLVEALRSGIDDASLKWIVAVGQLLAYFSAAAIAMGLYQRQQDVLYWALGGLFVISFDAFVDTFGRLQLETWILTLLVLMLLCARRQLAFMAGLLLGLAVALKLYPVLFALYFVMTRQWRGLVGAACGFVGASAATLVVVDAAQQQHYWFDIVPLMLHEPVSGGMENFSLPGMVLWSGASQWVAALTSSMFMLAMLVVTVCAASVSLAERHQHRVTQLGFAMLAILVVGGMKNAWMNYQLLLLLPVVILLAQALQPGREDVPTIILLVVASLMMFYGKPFRLLPIASWFGNEATLGWFAVYLRASATPVLLLAATRLFVREWQLVRERQRATRTQTA